MELKSRRDLAKYFNELGFKVGAEVGVAAGKYSEQLCQEIPNLRLYCVDPWQRQSSDYDEAQARLKPYNCVFMRLMSDEAAKEFKDGSLDFVYIDANHYFDYVLQDLICWRRKVRKGGIVAGHDHFISRRPESTLSVVQAVDAYVSFHKYKLNVIPGNKNAPTFGEKHPNWWFTV